MIEPASRPIQTPLTAKNITPVETPPDTALFLDLVLYPQRSMKPKHFQRFLLVIIGVCGLASLRFYVAGAWPVAAFLLLDIVALWLAFAISYRRGRLRETIQLSETDLIITRTDPAGRLASWRFEPYWVNVSLSRSGSTEDALSIHHHDKTVTLGSYLRPKERRQVAARLKAALTEWRAGPQQATNCPT